MKVPHLSPGRMRLRNNIRRFIVASMTYCGFLAARKALSRGPRARILVYHSVSDDPYNPFAVSPAEFDRQMGYLAAHCNVLALSELVGILRDGGSFKPNSVSITFDDGYRDNYTNALPVLRKYGLPAAIFLIGGRIGTDRGAADNIEFLKWDEINTMAAHRISFGSHTMNHPSLRSLEYPEAEKEIVESKRYLEQKLGVGVAGLAYPYGTYRDVTAEIEASAQQAGYDFACVATNGTVGRTTSPFSLPRTKIEFGDSMKLFARALAGGLDVFVLLDQLRMILGKRRT